MPEIVKKCSVLFVDDEENILQGIRRLTRSLRNQWTIDFCSSGERALTLIKTKSYDVIVSDMRMPGIDGADVLTVAAEVAPESLRIILSGYADQNQLIRAVGPAHQIFSKPCDLDELIREVNRFLRVKEILPTLELRALVSSLSSVPVLSEHYSALIELLDDPRATKNQISEAVSSDLGLSSQLLRLVNSSYFSVPNKIEKCSQAIDLLGLETVRATMLLSKFNVTNGSEDSIKEIELLANRSLKIGCFARRLSQTLGLDADQTSDASSAGLLCHIGTAILRADMPEEFRNAMLDVERGECSILEAERKHFGATHAELSAYLVGLWGFSNTVVETIAHHHAPSTLGPAKELSALTIVHIAQATVHLVDTTPPNLFADCDMMKRFDVRHLTDVHLIDRLDEFCQLAESS